MIKVNFINARKKDVQTNLERDFWKLIKPFLMLTEKDKIVNEEK